MQNQVGITKRNAITEVADQLKQLNMERGTLAGRTTGTPATVLGGSSPRVRSAQILADPTPLTEEEVKERDDAARALGILPREEEISTIAPIQFKESIPPRELIPQFKPKLLDFKNVERIDLINNTVWVDGFQIPIPEKDIGPFKEYVLKLSLEYVTEQLAKAFTELKIPLSQTASGDNGEPKPKESEEPKKVQRVRKRNRKTASE